MNSLKKVSLTLKLHKVISLANNWSGKMYRLVSVRLPQMENTNSISTHHKKDVETATFFDVSHFWATSGWRFGHEMHTEGQFRCWTSRIFRFHPVSILWQAMDFLKKCRCSRQFLSCRDPISKTASCICRQALRSSYGIHDTGKPQFRQPQSVRYGPLNILEWVIFINWVDTCTHLSAAD